LQQKAAMFAGSLQLAANICEYKLFLPANKIVSCKLAANLLQASSKQNSSVREIHT
jgi:hypothetical protein